jgi:hypothetical protein
MKRQQLLDTVRQTWYRDRAYNIAAQKAILPILNRLEDRISGRKGAEAARERFGAALKNYGSLIQKQSRSRRITPEERRHAWIVGSAKELAAKAGQKTDEHGTYNRGDHFRVYGLDFVQARISAPAPYCDHGGEGLAIVCVDRIRIYAGSSDYHSSGASTYYMVGRNEAGTYFAHPVGPKCRTVKEALTWIWQGREMDIIQRQGDIALISTNGGPKLPLLPSGHVIDDTGVVKHATHPDLPLPGKGQRIIVARRAADRANQASRD